MGSQDAILPTEKANQYNLNSPLGHKMGLNAAEPFYFKRTDMSWPVAQLITPQSLGLQSNSKHYPAGKRKQKLRSEESSFLKRNRTFVCFTAAAFSDLLSTHANHKYVCAIRASPVGQICGWDKSVWLQCHWVIREDLVLGLSRECCHTWRRLKKHFNGWLFYAQILNFPSFFRWDLPLLHAGQVFAMTLPSSDASLQGKRAGERWLTKGKRLSQVLKGGVRN